VKYSVQKILSMKSFIPGDFEKNYKRQQNNSVNDGGSAHALPSSQVMG